MRNPMRLIVTVAGVNKFLQPQTGRFRLFIKKVPPSKKEFLALYYFEDKEFLPVCYKAIDNEVKRTLKEDMRIQALKILVDFKERIFKTHDP